MFRKFCFVARRQFSSSIRASTSNQRLLKTEREINEYLNKSTWAVKDLISDPNDRIQISDKTMDKIVRLSGLTNDVSSVEREKLASALGQQMGFVKHLYDNDTSNMDSTEEANDRLFRLIASDHILQKPVSLQDLLEEIESLPGKVDKEKGEIDFDIRKLHPDSESSYFTVKARQG
ncbi:hypothetical protein HYPBUDRAFT_5871 [Hyphopichia burtonii NRRL Y-1933]|uniref:Glu-AdT subunit F n=1 Tax=Hyphopichia burtonii NRRL Y-1933 TaxID=984485 RepID=A0A1E4RLD8_9ASCO|nr:hypothetical protein HYPBUDRAFT_5871 [Hyphopichia burtonii NRRL Y-1933]ODV68056.1 hypothetical protein HYPBUDRAFT_5871 [Hyphopichia burtonii NRRL Y-1933]